MRMNILGINMEKSVLVLSDMTAVEENTSEKEQKEINICQKILLSDTTGYDRVTYMLVEDNLRNDHTNIF